MAYNTKNIIRDAAGAPVPQFYNPVADAYQPLTGVDLGGGRYGYNGLAWGKTAGGLYAPIKVADDGTVLTQLTGSTVADSQALPMTQAKKDAIARVYENIINEIGLENIAYLLPCWETSGTELKCLINPKDFSLVVNGPTLGQTGILNQVPSYDGVNDYAQQKAVTESNGESAQINMTSSTMKVAQKLAPISTNVGFVQVAVKRIGNPNATMQVAIVEDNAGQPTGATVWTSLSIINASAFDTAAIQRWGFPSSATASLALNKTYWVVISYASVTLVDSSNYVSVSYDPTGAYGQPLATYNGTTWAVITGQSVSFALYNDIGLATDDFTLIVCANWDSTVQKQTLFNAFGNNLGGHFNGMLKYEYPNLQFITATGSQVEVNTNRFSFNQNNVLAGTFSKSASTDKQKFYLNGTLVGTVSGTAGTGVFSKTYPAHISYFRMQPYATRYVKGTVGPIILTKNVLSAASIGRITNYLLTIRRMQEAV